METGEKRGSGFSVEMETDLSGAKETRRRFLSNLVSSPEKSRIAGNRECSSELQTYREFVNLQMLG
jgi:hypothetical protein